VAGSIIDYIAAQVDFPEIDIRQRLTVSKGYGVTEIYIPKGSKYDNKTIFESGLRDAGINVLTLYRAGKAIPNPKEERVLEADDRLLCFGKLELMRGMVPEKTRKRRRPKMTKLRKNNERNKSV